MGARSQDIEEQAIQLPAEEREALAERLMRSVDDLPLTEVEEAWVAEAERRFGAWRRGEREGVPVSEAFKRLRKVLDQ